jgi:nitroreductase
MLEKPAPTAHPIHDLLRDRWSPRAFDPQPIPAGELLSLLEAARWSPSSANQQPWSFVVIPRSDEDAFARGLACLSENNARWAANAPLLLLTVAKLTRDNGAPNRTALYDMGQAVAHLTIQATALGLKTHQMGGFSQERARELFAVPDGYEPVTFIAVGRQGDHTLLPDEQRSREEAPRTRKPLADFVFGDCWGKAYGF